MRIFFLCHRIPYPPDKGEKIRAFHQLRALAARHEVDVFTLADQPADVIHKPKLLEYCRRVTIARLNPKLARVRAIPFLATKTPLTLPCFYSRKLNQEVRRALQERSYDRIFVSCSSMAQYVEKVRDIPILMDLVDIDSNKWTQYAAVTKFPFSAIYRREGIRLQDYEQRISEKFSRVLVTTEREAQLIRQFAPAARVEVIPNGVDTEYFRPFDKAPDASSPTLVFTGDMSYFPNEDAVTFFATKALPEIRREIPAVKFLVVGRNPSPKVLQLQQIEGVEVTGFVPDVRTYLARAHVSVAPFLIAAGIQNKILEAMACGLPVVATPRTAQGLSESVRAAIETGETAGDIARSVVHLLRNREFAIERGAEGRRRVMADYNWQAALSRLLQFIEEPGRKDVAGGKTAPEGLLLAPSSSSGVERGNS